MIETTMFVSIPTFKSKEIEDREEKKSYKIEFDCYETAIKECGFDTYCLEQVGIRRNKVKGLL